VSANSTTRALRGAGVDSNSRDSRKRSLRNAVNFFRRIAACRGVGLSRAHVGQGTGALKLPLFISGLGRAFFDSPVRGEIRAGVRCRPSKSGRVRIFDETATS
jgi:hypothetical protein